MPSDELIKKGVEHYCRIFNKKNQNYQIKRMEGRKPYLEPAFLKFSISHSGEYKLIAVSEKKVGIDIEKIKEIDFLPILSRFFPNNEKKCKDIKEFFRLWTAKEAYTKKEESDIIGVLQTPLQKKDICHLDIIKVYTIALSSEDNDILFMFL